jgi:hypothetical protein
MNTTRFLASRAQRQALTKLTAEVQAAGELEEAIANIAYYQHELAKAKAKARKAFDQLTGQLGYAEADKVKTLLMSMNQFRTDPTRATYKAFNQSGQPITVTIPED